MEDVLKYCDLKEKNGGAANNEKELIPKREHIQNALLRFMLRCLSGELDHNQALAPYIIYKEDIWDQEVLDNNYQLDNLETLLPNDDIKLESIYCMYNVVHKLNKDKL